MNPNYPHLFSPVKVGNLTLKSRLLASPISLFDLGLTKEHRHTVNDFFFYKLRAAGGAAMVTVGDSPVHPTGNTEGRNTPKVMIYMRESIPLLCDITDEIHRYGAIANIELNHNGLRSAFPGFDGWSADEFVRDNGGKVHAMDEAMIAEVAEHFGIAAENAKIAGFDMVMVHAAHGWLLGQFLSPTFNHRTDRFGGSLENRARFLFMVIDSIRRHCGRGFPIEVRISGAEVVPEDKPHITIEESIALAKMLDGKIDLLHVSAGTDNFDAGTMISHPSMFSPHGVNVTYAQQIKPHVKMPVVTVGSLTNPEEMEEIIASGKADMVAVGRSLIADPFLPEKARHGQGEDIRPCLRCYQCLGVGEWNGGVRCSVNPLIGRAWEAFYPPAPSAPKKVLIAGGGPAGMQAALTAAERGHEVILCEKEGVLGGTIRYCEGISFKQDMWNYLQYMIRMVEKAGIDVRLNTEVTPALLAELRPDKVIAAVGATPIVPPIPGIERATALLDVYMKKLPVGDNIVIVGGGLAGVEAAIEFAHQGKKPVIIEMQSAYAPDCNMMHKMAINVQIQKYAIDIRLNARCAAIEDDGVVYEDLVTGEKVKVEGDTVLYAAGMRSRESVVSALRDECEEFQWVGDCRRPGQVIGASRGGYDAAMNL